MFRRYALGVFIACGVYVTGVLWPDRPGKTIHAEDAAYLVAGVAERQIMALNQASSNTVMPYASWDLMYGKILCQGRNMLTNNAPILWLDKSITPITDGNYLCGQNQTWISTSTNYYHFSNGINQTVIQWQLSTPTNNAFDILPVTATRVPTAGLTYMPLGTNYVSSNNYPISPICYGIQATNLSTAWEHGNIWTRAGLGTNVYKLGCELLQPEILSIKLLGGGGFTVTNTVTMPYLIGTVSVTTPLYCTATNTSIFMGALYEIDSNLRSDRGYFTALANPSSFTGKPIGFDGAFRPTMNYGQSNTVYVYPTTAWGVSGDVGTMTLKAYGGISISPDKLVYTNGVTGELSFKISAVDHFSGLYTIDWQGKTHSFPIPVVSSNFFSTVNVSANDGNSVNETISCVESQLIVRTNQSIKTNDLNQAKTMLENLQSTISIYDYSALSVSNCVNYYGDNSTFANGVRVLSNPDIQMSAYNTAGISGMSVTASNSCAWDGSLFSINATAYATKTLTDYYYGSPYWDWYKSFEGHFNSKVVMGSLPYPSAMACASGYVSKVTVYVVAYADIPAQVDYHNYFDRWNPDFPYTFETDFTVKQPSDYESLKFGLINYLCTVPSFITSYTESRIDNYQGQGLNKIRISKVFEIENPTSIPVFTLGSSAPVIPTDKSDYLYWNYQCPKSVDNVYGISYENWYMTLVDTIKIKQFIVVTDFKFNFYGSGETQPTIYTPAWGE